MTERYISVTGFVDHFSDFTYIQLMDKIYGESTVKAKHTFECVQKSHSVIIQNHHSKNGLFDTKIFKDAVYTAGQTLSFCGVNYHHQNGKVETSTKDVTPGSFTPLIHTAHQYPEAIHKELWTSALKEYTNLRNALPTGFKLGERIGKKWLTDTYNTSQMSKFTRNEIEANLNHLHTLESPVYAPNEKLKQKKSHKK